MSFFAALLSPNIRYISIFLIALTLLTGCNQSATFSRSSTGVSQAEPVSLPTGAPTLEPTPPNTRVIPPESLTPSPTPTITPIPDEVRGLVVEVIDGDTIAVVLEGDPPRQIYEVRYIGIETPPNVPGQPWGVVAYETNHKMTNLKVARLVRDQTETDDQGRLLRYVYINNELLSIILTEQGLAQAAPDGVNSRFETEIAEVETRAKEGKLGIWSDSLPTATPTRTQAVETETEATPAPADDTPEAEGAPEATAVPQTTAEAEETVSATAEIETTAEGEEFLPLATLTQTSTPTATTTAEVESTVTPSPTATAQPTGANNSDTDSLQGPQ